MNQSIRRIPIPILIVLAFAAAILASPATAAEAPSVVPGRYIVVFKSSVDNPANLAESQTENRDGELGFVYRHGLKGYSAELSKGAVEALRNDPRVASVEPDVYGGATAQTIPTGVDRVFAPLNPITDIDEVDDARVNVDVAVLDTGVYYTHPDLNIGGRTDCSEGTEKEATCVNGAGLDSYGHGTHVSGTVGAIDNGTGVAGVAPGARIWAVKVLDFFGGGYLSEFIAGINWITATRLDEDPSNDIEVANASLRFLTTSSEAFEKAIKASLEAGVVYVAAAGNEVEAVKYLPGNYPGVITVSALADFDGKSGEKAGSTACRENYEAIEGPQKDDALAGFSNFGPLVDIAAPGVCIRSTTTGGGYSDMWWGTSMASPQVAGAAALLASKSKPTSLKDVEAIRSTLVQEGKTAESEGLSTWNDTSGDGIKEPLLYAGSLQPPTATTEAASSIAPGEATLNATVDPESLKTTYQLEYGKTTSYGKLAPAAAKEVGSGTSGVKVAETVKALEPNTTYHYRVIATNIMGTTKGEDKTFTTAKTVKPPTFSFAFGSAGSGNGQFNDLLLGITVDSEGNVWVADRANSRVQKFNSKGEYLMQFGTKGTGNGQFRYPQGLDIDSSSNVWVVDKLNNRVQKFNSKGEYLSQFGGSGSGNGQFASPEGLDIDSSGNVWVVDRGNNRVQKFNSKGEYLSQFGKAGAGEGQLSGAMDLAVDSAGEIWVAENGNDRVQHFSADGKYISKFGSAGSADGQFQSPMGIDVDAEGNLWITDLESDRVQAFYPEGDFLTKFGTEGSGEGQFKGAGGVAIDAKGSLWVTDRDNDRVQKWVPSAPYPVITGAASSITRFKGTLNGSINPEGKATSYYFEYGTTSAYGAKVPLSAKSIGSGSSPVKVSEALSNLKAGTTYHYRVVATTEKGTTYGENRNFKTLAGAGPEAQWRLNGKTLTELGVKEATLVSSGTFTIEIPSSSITVSCTESGSGKISGTNGLEREVTLNCKLLKFEAQCTYSPTFIFFTGTGTELHPTGKELILKTSGECPWGKMTTLGLPANFAHEVGTESKQVQTAIYATGSYGAWNAYYTGYSTWELTGAQAGKTLGLW